MPSPASPRVRERTLDSEAGRRVGGLSASGSAVGAPAAATPLSRSPRGGAPEPSSPSSATTNICIGPRSKIAAPATFSHVISHDALKSTTSVPGPARQLKLYQLRGTRTSQFQPKHRVEEGDSEYKCVDQDDVNAAAAEILRESDPWYVQDVQSILAVERIRLRQQKLQKEADAKLKEDEKKRAAELALLEAQRRSQSRKGSGVGSGAALTPAEAREVRVADIVKVRKLRTRDVDTAIAEIDVQLQSTTKRYIRSRRCVRKSVELLGLREQELRLARERSLRLYAAASATLVQQGVAQGQIKSQVDFDDLYPSVGINGARRGKMVSVKTIRAADALYTRYERIEYLWNRLRYHARVVGRAVLDGRTFDYKRRLSSYSALADVVLLAHLPQQAQGQLEAESESEDAPPPPPPIGPAGECSDQQAILDCT